MGSSFVDADLEFAGIGVLPEIVFLLEDLAKGTVPFDTVSQIRGKMGILYFYFPIKVNKPIPYFQGPFILLNFFLII
jgi:hypothetical protein